MIRYQPALLFVALAAAPLALGPLVALADTPAPAPPAAIVTPTPVATPTSPSDLPTTQPAPTVAPGRAYTPDMTPLPVPPPLTLPPPSNLPPDVPMRPLTMDEAIAIALRHQPSIDSAAAGVTLARGRTIVTRAPLNPQLDVTSNYQLVSGIIFPPSDSTASSGNVNGGASGSNNAEGAAEKAASEVSPLGLTTTVTGSQLLYDFEHTRNLVRSAQEEERVAVATLSQSQSDTMLTVKQDFIAYVQDQRLIQVQQVNVQDEAEHLRQAEGLYRAGTGLPSDVVQAQAAVADAINSLVAAENTSDTARIALALIMGIDPRTPLLTVSVDQPEIDDTDLQRLLDLGQQLRPEVQEAVYTVRSDEYALHAARVTNAPVISLSASLENLPFGNSQVNLLSAGVGLTWLAGDGGVTHGTVIEAQATLQQAQDQLRTAQLTVVNDATTAYLSLHSSRQRLSDLQIDVRAAQETLRLESGRYAAGIGTALDVLDAEAALVTALTNEVNAVADVENARASLAHAIGMPPPPIAPLPPDKQNLAPPALAAPPPPFQIPAPVPALPPIPPPPIELPYIAPGPLPGNGQTIPARPTPRPAVPPAPPAPPPSAQVTPTPALPSPTPTPAPTPPPAPSATPTSTPMDFPRGL